MSQEELIQSTFSLPGGKGNYVKTLVDFVAGCSRAHRRRGKTPTAGSTEQVQRGEIGAVLPPCACVTLA